MYKFKKGILPVNFSPYFTSINKIHNHSSRFSEKNYFYPRVNSLYCSKFLSYLGFSGGNSKKLKRTKLSCSISIGTKKCITQKSTRQKSILIFCFI